MFSSYDSYCKCPKQGKTTDFDMVSKCYKKPIILVMFPEILCNHSYNFTNRIRKCQIIFSGHDEKTDCDNGNEQRKM